MVHASMSVKLDRQMFSTNRASEYFDARELQSQTGQVISNFATVVLKELCDNALDAAEMLGVDPVIALSIHDQDGILQIAVGDNAGGISSETLERILDFNTRTSDKAAYRTPTRGAQGNALKTVLGIPFALGGFEDGCVPVQISAQGAQHVIKAWVDPAGELRIDHRTHPANDAGGTVVHVTLDSDGQDFEPERWARGFSLFNPHATVQIRAFLDRSQHANNEPIKIENLYRPTVALKPHGDWRKFLPTDLPSIWWFDLAAFEKLIFAHIAATRRGERDLTLRDFVRTFRGLSQTAQAKKVCDQVPGFPRLTTLEDAPTKIKHLFQVMRQATTPPAPDVLGKIGRAHFENCFAEWFTLKQEVWYKSEQGTLGGIPFIIEVALAEAEENIPSTLWTGVNFSPTFGDPLAGTRLNSGKVSAFGINSYLTQAHAFPSAWTHQTNRTVAAVHLTCPALEFLDRGKTRLRIPTAMANTIASALWSVSKTLYQEEEHRKKDVVRAQRAEHNRAQPSVTTWTLKDAVFAVVAEAMAKASGNGQYPVSTRNLYYPVRDLIQRHTTRDLDYDYFSQTLIVAYQREHGPLSGLYYDPRGVLHEPHTSHTTPLGTREIEAYQFPDWLYNKILYVEKKGMYPLFEAVRLAERYDMAIIAAEGYASEAARVLFAQADKQQSYQLFVLHDADPHGYNIARTLQEATARMPGYQVDVIDLGFRLEDALARGLQTEKFTRKKALPQGLVLTDVERRYFTGTKKGEKSWECERVELNAMLPADLVTYVEAQLQANGVRPKVVPPDLIMREEATKAARLYLRGIVDDMLDDLVNSGDLVDTLLADISAEDFEVTPDSVAAALANRPSLRWLNVVTDTVSTHLNTQQNEFRTKAREALRARLSA